eukprot:4975701-Pyramimonas_sp.AAC.1
MQLVRDKGRADGCPPRATASAGGPFTTGTSFTAVTGRGLHALVPPVGAEVHLYHRAALDPHACSWAS